MKASINAMVLEGFCHRAENAYDNNVRYSKKSEKPAKSRRSHRRGSATRLCRWQSLLLESPIPRRSPAANSPNSHTAGPLPIIPSSLTVFVFLEQTLLNAFKEYDDKNTLALSSTSTSRSFTLKCSARSPSPTASVDHSVKFKEASKDGNLIPLYRSIFSDHLTPVLAYRCLVKEDDRDAPSFLFESVEPGLKASSVGRYSRIGAQPTMEIVAKENMVTVMDHHEGVKTEEFVEDRMVVPRRIMEQWKPQRIDELPDAFCEKKKIPFSNAPLDDRNLPDVHLGLYDDVIVFDHVEKKAYVIHWVRLDQYSSVDEAFNDGTDRLEALVSKIHDIVPEANLQLLFTVVESAPSETVRSNCTIALGDLAVRFPNLLEPWTENMYARLHDPSVSVRTNAVLVLSQLILNDMMKVKGHINEMAMRLEDENKRISNLAKLFFNELSKKGNNPIYNLLPDILGKLSNQDLKRESFFNIMQFLIGSIKKDKQMEALVEKLCHRFSGVTDARQWENISYCLSQLSFTDKGIKKLIDLFKVYEHVLSNETVPKQPGNTECGYYVCKFMKEIIDNGLDVLVNTNIGDGKQVYKDFDLDGIREDWAHYVSNFVLA
ncbi:hypothetical protein LXL04_039298 [Taraxacum kok-saghyz]